MQHSSIDTEAHWTKSGWGGWVYGWKLHLACVAASVWIPLRTQLTPVNDTDNEQAPALIYDLPAEVRFIFGDQHYNAPNVREVCEHTQRILLTTQYGPYPHTVAGGETAAFSINSVRWRLKTSTNTSRVSSMGMDRYLRKGSSTRNASPWVQSSFTNLFYSTAFNKTST